LLRSTPGKRANEKNPEETRRDKEGKKREHKRKQKRATTRAPKAREEERGK